MNVTTSVERLMLGAGENAGRVRTWRPEVVYSIGLALVAAIVLAAVLRLHGPADNESRLALSFFFVAYGLFTIGTGYRHPKVGYVSFDRVSQVASILVLGPVTAAWVNGLASLLYPWKGIRQRTPVARMVTASLNNAGLMTLMVLSCGALYAALGGAIPLLVLDLRAAALLGLLILAMQVVNQAGLGIHYRLRDGTPILHFSRFVLTLETTAGLAGVFVAIIINRMELPVVALLVIVSGGGMMVLTQFARMRVALERMVEERTRVLHQKTVELEHLASRDQLTGLGNRRFAEQYIDRAVEEHHRYGREFTIALIDLDHFKSINDQQSHEVGDEVLKRVARIFGDRCRDSDLVARYGGEEFLLGFPEADVEAVVRICEQLRKAVTYAEWSDLAPNLRVSFSAGVAEMQPGLDRVTLVGIADEKLYEAKKSGRNSVIG